ncbi:MAG: hypothetical protein J6R80_06450, partial [Kiritimatiellae bacterium]|nr:hypothetical protein [Kiritimatiellia bacterium]
MNTKKHISPLLASLVITIVCHILLAGFDAASAASCPQSLDWQNAHEFAPGMKYLHITLDEPRLMENYLVRVDMSTPSLRVTGTGRSVDWGKPMSDVTNRVVIIDTLRQKTRDFLDQHRLRGTNMVLAVNTAPWNPWEHPFT